MKDILNKPFNTCTTSVIDKLNTYTVEYLKQKSFNIYHIKPSSCKECEIYKHKRRDQLTTFDKSFKICRTSLGVDANG